MEQNRITIPQWQGIKAGQEVETGRNFQAKGRRKGLHSESCTVRGIRSNRTKDRKGRLNAVTGVGRPFYFLRLVEIT